MSTGRLPGTNNILVLRWSKTPTAGTTVLSGTDDAGQGLAYTVGYEQVYLNGVLLVRGSDYTATNGTSITLTSATVTGDIINVIGQQVISITDVYTTSQSNTLYVKQLNGLLTGPEEVTNIVAASATGTINVDLATSGIWYYTSNAGANFTLNFRYNSTTTLASALAVGQSATFSFLNTNGATAYYPSTIQIDGVTVTPKWSGGTAPTAGNASAVDAWSFTIIKTAATPTYTVFAAGAVKYA